MKRVAWIVATAAVAFGGGMMVDRAWSAGPKAGARDDSQVVARYEGGVVTSRDVEEELAARGTGAAERFATPEARRELVTEMVRRRLLIERARASGLDTEAEPRLRIERLLAETFLERTLEPSTKVSDAEIEAYFAAHRNEFDQPERLRVAHILLKAPPGDPQREKRHKEAAVLLDRIRTASAKDFYAFDTAARAQSEDAATRPLGGELPAMTRDELAVRFGATAAAELAALPRSGTLLEHAIETSDGFELLRLVSRTPAVHAGIAELGPALKRRAAAEKKAAALRALQADLDAASQLQIADDALAQVASHK